MFQEPHIMYNKAMEFVWSQCIKDLLWRTKEITLSYKPKTRNGSSFSVCSLVSWWWRRWNHNPLNKILGFFVWCQSLLLRLGLLIMWHTHLMCLHHTMQMSDLCYDNHNLVRSKPLEPLSSALFLNLVHFSRSWQHFNIFHVKKET